MSRIPLVEAGATPPAVFAVYERMEKLGFPLFNVFKPKAYMIRTPPV